MEEKPAKCQKCFRPSKKKRIILNIVNLIVFGGLLASILLSGSIVEASKQLKTERNAVIEQTWREQQRTVLQDFKSQFLLDIYEGQIDWKDKSSVYDWSKEHLSGVKLGGPTGDLFVVDLSDEQIIWNTSPDLGAPIELTPPIYLEDTTPNFADPESATKIFEEIRKYYSTTSQSNLTWNYDGSLENLEWVIIPSDALGFTGAAPYIDGKKNPNYKAYLIVSGVQQDEILAPFVEIDKMCDKQTNNLIIFNYILTIGGILFIFWFFYLEYRHD